MGEGSSGRCCPEDPSKTHSSDATYKRSRRRDRRGGGCQGDRRRRHREVVRGDDGEELGKGECREQREGAGGGDEGGEA